MKTTKSDLTAARLRELLHYAPETGVFTKRIKTGKWPAGHVVGTPDRHGYTTIWVDGTVHRAHRLAYLYVYGRWPEGDIDHVNRVRSDNRIKNLRAATRSENCQNKGRQSNNVSGRTGVAWHSAAKQWEAYIWVQRSKTYLGTYPNIDDAIAARKAAEAVYHPFAPKEAAHA